MSRSLTDNAIASFDARVKAAYQGMGILRSSVMFKTGVVGSTHRFNKIGKGTATRRTPQTDVVPMNIVHGNATATLEDWNAPEYTDIFDQQKVNYEEQQQLAGVIAGAIGRREDQLIVDALDAASTTLTVASSVGGSSSGLNTAKLRRAARLLDDQGVPRGKGERTALCSTEGKEQLLGDDDANTADKNIIKALYDGEIMHWMGFDFRWMEVRDEGGLPKATNDRTCFCYHKSAAGLAVGIDMRTEVNYIPVKTSWLANGLFTAGAVTIDALGVVEMTTVEAA
jgi:hypothetical protein